MTKIEWVARPGTKPETWNPVTGCTKISAGCRNCYAERMARRLAGRCGYPEAPHHFDVTLRPERLEEPLHWRKPRTVFVCSMSDLFHDAVPYEFIDHVIHIVAATPQHTYQILTKRAARMEHYFAHGCFGHQGGATWGMPLENAWLGVTTENQEQADKRIPHLLNTPASLRFVSVEPVLGPVDMCRFLPDPSYEQIRGKYHFGLDWIIIGGESGPGARLFKAEWALDVIEQCQLAGVPVFMKQLGSRVAKSMGKRGKMDDPSEWVEELRIRQWPG